MQYEEIMNKLKSLANPEAVKGMARFGINLKNTYGVSIPSLRKMAKEIGMNHNLANRLWGSKIHEARILASLISNPEMVTEEQIEKWAKDFDSWDVCDLCCGNLFDKTKYAYKKAVEWSSRDEEFVKRAGFVLMATLAVHDKKAQDEDFLKFFPLMIREATDRRNFVKKAVNWALRQIGKRNLNLNKKAIKTAKEIKIIESKSARWIASDAIRELESESVQKRLRRWAELDMDNIKKVVRGQKVSLRPMKPKEVELIHRWANNPDVMPYWNGKRSSLKQVKDYWRPHYFSDKDPYSGRCFAIEVQDEPIGMVNYNKIDRVNKSVDMDIMIGQKASWNKGYGTDALRTFCGFLFRRFKLNRIWLGAYAYNLRALRAYEKAGFKKEGIMREDALINGKFVDSVLLSILRKEFKK